MNELNTAEIAAVSGAAGTTQLLSNIILTALGAGWPPK